MKIQQIVDSNKFKIEDREDVFSIYTDNPRRPLPKQEKYYCKNWTTGDAEYIPYDSEVELVQPTVQTTGPSGVEEYQIKVLIYNSLEKIRDEVSRIIRKTDPKAETRLPLIDMILKLNTTIESGAYIQTDGRE